ncbi:DEAD-domain-containing protein [Parathielavia appendiculata]|uniref:RNA helicase n=1 Tax=Parathielavia appendiculata TaxID=2587402 RepID=A0AAN6Z3B4_9PEZI|nr:DEAD-domain-containing protein [Parathielavia appendiculata]
MAPSQKRKNLDDDFIFTISDNDEPEILEEEVVDAALSSGSRPFKKAKTASAEKKNKKQNRKRRQQAAVGDQDDNGTAAPEEEASGLWGTNDADDGAMDSEFEFALGGADAVFDVGEFEGWGFEGAKKGMNGAGEAAKKGVDLDEIIRRRREKKDGKGASSGKQEQEDGREEDRQDQDDMDAELDLDEEVLAEDAFGMGVGSDVDEEEAEEGDEDEDGDAGEGEVQKDEDGEEAASDDDSVTTPLQHPEDEGDFEDDDEEDAEEEAKRKEFFAAPEETEKSGKKGELSSFQAMSLSRPILRGLTSVGFTKPTPIQAKTIPIALMGKDVVGGAVTGSGKTAAFVVPILERLLYRPKKVPTTRVVILTPTRELAIQCHSVATKLASHTDIKFCLAVGGLSLKVQEAELRLRPDVVIATPGRFIDHIRNSASFAVETVEILVLDEADRMLEDGFADELNEILTTLPKSRQTMLFSATMTSSVDKLVRVGMNKPARIMVDSQKKIVGTLTQEFVRLRPGREEKRMGYLVHICKTLYTERVIIFFRQKKIAHRTRIIFGLLGLSCAELHGSMNQAQRIASVEDFRDGKVSFLLATDLASRGLDIKGVDTVINYEAPQTLEIYVHRVGRTARAGRSGVAITLAAEPDRKVVKAAVKTGKAQGAKIISRVIDPADADKWQAQVDGMDEEIEEVLREEKEEKQLAQVEMQVQKGENLIKYEEEIKSRPKRTWFATDMDKKAAKEAGRAELNGLREAMKKKGEGKLSNKDKKRLDSKAERGAGLSWKKGRAERDGKGAVLNVKKVKKAKLKRPAGRKGRK